jgi:N-acyl homoserine lactone hydrolase
VTGAHRGGGTAQELFVVPSGGETTLRTLFDPWSPDCAESFFIPYYFYLVRHPNGWVLVDCGAHPDLATDPAARLAGQVEFSQVSVRPGDDVLSRLAGLGLTAADVTDVVVTHLHYDHSGGLALLPGARVHVQRAELEFATDPPVYQQLAYVAADWAPVSGWVVHDGAFDLFGDGAVVAVPTPGHTPGHQSVLVQLPGAAVICVGDAAYHPTKMAERRLPGYLWSPDALVASWRHLEQLRADVGAELLFSHYPSAGQIPLAPAPYTPGAMDAACGPYPQHLVKDR